MLKGRFGGVCGQNHLQFMAKQHERRACEKRSSWLGMLVFCFAAYRGLNLRAKTYFSICAPSDDKYWHTNAKL